MHNLPPVEKIQRQHFVNTYIFIDFFVTLITRFFQEIIVHHAISIQ